jgi:hypothetical protein
MINDGRLSVRAKPGRKAKRRNLRLVKAKLSRRSQTPRAVLIDQYPDDKQRLHSIPTTSIAKPFATGVFTDSMAPCGPLYSSPANTPVTKGFDCQ